VHGLLDIFGHTPLYAAMLELAVPVFLAALGETFAERAGLINIGLEAMMLMGAFGGVLGASLSHNAIVGVLAAVACGMLTASLQAVLAINLGVDQVVAGIALNIGALGLTSFLAFTVWVNGPPLVAHFDVLHPAGLRSIPLLGPIVFKQNALVYLTVILAVLGWWLLARTRWGLEVRASGQDPRAADSLGIAVLRRRWETMLICGALAGLGGAFLALGELYTFADGMSGGRGFIALAVVIIAGWSPSRAILAALLFGLCEALALRIQAVGSSIPYTLILALPYVVAIFAYAGLARRAAPPAALARPYLRR